MPLSEGPASAARLVRPPGGARLHLLLGAAQIGLGALNVATSLAALTLAASARVRHSCPFWAGLCALLCGLIGVVSWKRPIAIVIKFFMVLSAVCVLLNLAGSILSCQKAQLVSSLHHCHTVTPTGVQAGSEATLVCVCCDHPKLNGCSNAAGDSIRLYPALQGCQFVRHSLKDLMFAVCALSVVSVAVCVLATSTRCMQLISSDALHSFITHRLEHGVDDCPNPRDSYFTGEDYGDFVAPAPPPPYDPPAYAQHAPPEPLRPGSLGLVSYPLGLATGPSAESPDGWCASELPPPYEAAVLGNAFMQQTSSLEEQITDTSSYTTSNYHATACHDGGQSPGATSGDGTASGSEDGTSAGSYSVRAQGSTRSLEPSPSTTDATPTLASCCSSLGASDSPAEDGDRLPGYCERCGTHAAAAAAEAFPREEDAGPSDADGRAWTDPDPDAGAAGGGGGGGGLLAGSAPALCSCFGESGTETDLTASDEISVENFRRRRGGSPDLAAGGAAGEAGSAEERGERVSGSPEEQDDGWRSGDEQPDAGRGRDDNDEEVGSGAGSGGRGTAPPRRACGCEECRCGETRGPGRLGAHVVIVGLAEVRLLPTGDGSECRPERLGGGAGSSAAGPARSTRHGDAASDDPFAESGAVAATGRPGEESSEAGCRQSDDEGRTRGAAVVEPAARSAPVEEDATLPAATTEHTGLEDPSASRAPQPQSAKPAAADTAAS